MESKIKTVIIINNGEFRVMGEWFDGEKCEVGGLLGRLLGILPHGVGAVSVDRSRKEKQPVWRAERWSPRGTSLEELH